MKIIISPAKSLDFESSSKTNVFSQPSFQKESSLLNNRLKKLSKKKLSDLMKISPALANLNYERNQNWHQPFSLENSKQAIYAFTGEVFKGIDKFKLESKLYTWIYRIATNESLNFIKSKAKKFLMSSKEMMDYQINNLKEDPYFDGDELQVSLQKAINSLPTKQKLIFQMKYEQNMKFKEICEILETSEGGLKASYHIAVKKIKKELLKNQTF